jgi:hypothetical protein
MDAQFDRVKHIIEADLGRPIDSEEEIVLKSLYYFDRLIKLRNSLDSEFILVGDVAKKILKDIEARRKPTVSPRLESETQHG